MKRSWAAFAVIIAAMLGGAVGCNDYGNTFQFPTGASVSFVSPADAVAGGPAFTLTVNGNGATGIGFLQQTFVQFNGTTLATTFVNSGQVTAQVPASLIAKPGTVFIVTVNPHSGVGDNGLSNPVAFVINLPPTPVPTVTSMTPNSIGAGSASFTLTINGTNFLPASDPTGGSQVHWNSGPTQNTLPIVSISATQIQATVSAALVAAAGTTAIVTVYNPPSQQTTPSGGVPLPSAGGGGTSPNGLTFTVTNAAPTTASKSSAMQSALEETPSVSSDGRYVAFTAAQGDHTQVFVRDTCEGVAASAGCQPRSALVSAAADGTPANDDSHSPSVSSDGRFVAFSSAASNLMDSVPSGRQVYLRDTCAGAAASCSPSTQLVSVDPNGALVGTESILPSVSASGRFVAFVAVTPSHEADTSSALPKSKAAPGSTNGAPASATNSGYRQVFIRDTCLGASSCTPKTTRISLAPGDDSSPDARPPGPALSGGANHVALAGAKTSTLFAPSVAVDDRVFLAITNRQR